MHFDCLGTRKKIWVIAMNILGSTTKSRKSAISFEIHFNYIYGSSAPIKLIFSNFKSSFYILCIQNVILFYEMVYISIIFKGIESFSYKIIKWFFISKLKQLELQTLQIIVSSLIDWSSAANKLIYSNFKSSFVCFLVYLEWEIYVYDW